VRQVSASTATRVDGSPPDDASPGRGAQITTPEIANGAVTSDKLSDEVR
jgi:hypothetical protein